MYANPTKGETIVQIQYQFQPLRTLRTALCQRSGTPRTHVDCPGGLIDPSNLSL